MKRKNRFRLLKEKRYPSPAEDRKIRYDSHTLRNYPFGIMERTEQFTDCELERLKEMIASLNESSDNNNVKML